MRTIIEQIAFKIIASIIILITIAIQVQVIKDALLIDTTPPVYTMKVYTVLLAGIAISYLIYKLVGFVLDIIDLHKTYLRYKIGREGELSKSFKDMYKDMYKDILNEIENIKKDAERTRNSSPIQVTPEEAKRMFDESRVADTVNKTIEECMPQNPIDLKFDKMENSAKKVVNNLKKKKDVQK